MHIAGALDRCIVAVENASERVVGYVVCWPHSVGPLISDAGANVASVLFQAALEQFQKEYAF